MKTFPILLALAIFSNVLIGQTINTRTEYKVGKSGEYTVIKMSIQLNDTTIKAETNSNFTNTKSQKMDFDDLKSKLITDIRANDNFDIYVNRPTYMDEIFNLITSQQNKEKAKKIFDENNYKNAIKSSLNNSISIANGKTQKKIVIELNYPLIVKNTNELIFNEKSFQFDVINYNVEKQVIKIEK